MNASAAPRSLFQKIWDSHVVERLDAETDLLYIDRHLVTEVTSPQAFEGLRLAGKRVRRPLSTIAVADHNVPTTDRGAPIADEASRIQVGQLETNVREFGIPYLPLTSPNQGVVHVIGPEQGLLLPGMTVVCGDSHTSTHGALGTLGFGIGTSEVEHVLATQTIRQRRAQNTRITIDGTLGKGVTAKDLILAIIGKIGAAGGDSHVIEFAGSTVQALDMAGRMTICNMSVEAGARAGIIAPDETAFAYLEGRRCAPKGEAFLRAVEHWKTLPSDTGASFAREIRFDAATFAPMVTWGTSSDEVLPIDGKVPDPADAPNEAMRRRTERALAYMGLAPGQPLQDITIDAVFIGSCTNGRIEDLRAAAEIVRGRKVAPGVRALVVPGSGLVKIQAEREGLDQVFLQAGFQWRDAGCSMCIGMNPDRLQPGERCASTSNRNFEGRQGPGGRSHLLSPIMAAAAALSGRLTDVRLMGAEL